MSALQCYLTVVSLTMILCCIAGAFCDSHNVSLSKPKFRAKFVNQTFNTKEFSRFFAANFVINCEQSVLICSTFICKPITYHTPYSGKRLAVHPSKLCHHCVWSFLLLLDILASANSIIISILVDRVISLYFN